MTCALHGQAQCPLCDPAESLEDWIVREARAISGPRTHLQDSEAVIQFGLRVAGRASGIGRAEPPRQRTAPENMAVDAAGKSLPYTPEEVTRIMEQALRDGDVMAAILRMPTGDLAVQVFGPPSRELLDILDTTTRAYRRVLQGH